MGVHPVGERRARARRADSLGLALTGEDPARDRRMQRVVEVARGLGDRVVHLGGGVAHVDVTIVAQRGAGDGEIKVGQRLRRGRRVGRCVHRAAV